MNIEPSPTNGPLPCIATASLSLNYYGSGGGGGPSTVVSSFTFLSAQTAQISTLNVSSLSAVDGLSTSVITIPKGGQINLDEANLNLLFEDAANNAGSIFYQWPGTLEAVPYATTQYYDETTSSIRLSTYDYVKSVLTDDPPSGMQMPYLNTSSLNVSSINSAPATKAWFGTGEIGNIVAGVSEEVLPFSFSSIDSFCATANYSYNSAPTTALSSLYTYPSTVSSFLVRGQDAFAYAWTVVGV